MLVVLLLTTACARTAEPERELAWTQCGDDSNWSAAGPEGERRAHLVVECATLDVPADRRDSEAGSLGMALVRVRDDRAHDLLGSLVLNPGGPAASGLDFMPSWASWFPDALLERFDLVSFDPRGTGQSDPISCPDQPSEPLPDTTKTEGVAELARQVSASEAGCAKALGDRADDFGTDDVARDLDLLRKALGHSRLSYVGWSYGARLGAHYARLFPDNVRALVLDSPPDPDSVTARVVDAQVAGFEAMLGEYAATCDTRDSCPPDRDPLDLLASVRTQAREGGIRSGRPAGDPPADEVIVIRAVLGFLASPSSWPDLDTALAEANQGDSGSIYDMVDSLKGRSPAHPEADADDAMSVIGCTDSPNPPGLDTLTPEVLTIARSHPTFGTYGAGWLLACSGWPDSARRTLPAATTTTTAKILVLAGAADPNTPLPGAKALVRDLGPVATLMVSNHLGHTAFGSSPDVEADVVRYLIDAR
jgi:pimeloyl-ACP methyl ester carboxylesterase